MIDENLLGGLCAQSILASTSEKFGGAPTPAQNYYNLHTLFDSFQCNTCCFSFPETSVEPIYPTRDNFVSSLVFLT